MYIDLYAIQSVPPSNLNRDDTGSPKTAIYGGALRARVSSQAWNVVSHPSSFVLAVSSETLSVGAYVSILPIFLKSFTA